MNQKTNRHLIHGILRTTSDFTVTAFGEGYFDVSEFRVYAGAPSKGAREGKYPCTRTVKLPVIESRTAQAAIEAELLPDEGNVEHFHDDVLDAVASESEADPDAAGYSRHAKPSRKHALAYLPVIPSTLLRGRLRREMTEVVLDAIQARGDLIDLGVYRGLTSGNATGSPDGVGATFAQTTELQKSPLIGLFGGGPKLVAGALTAFTAYPICDATLNIGMIPASFEAQKNEAHPYQMTTVRVRTRKDDSIGGSMNNVLGPNLNLRVLDTVKDAPQAITEWLRQLNGEKAEASVENGEVKEKKEDAAEGSRSKLKVSNIFCTESVIPGVNFYARFIVDNELLDLAGLGLFLLSLERMANIQRLGSMGAHGFGMFDLELTIQDADDAGVPGVRVFERELGTGRYKLNRSAETISTAMAAWKSYTEKVTSVELARIYIPAPEVKPAKVSKKTASAAA